MIWIPALPTSANNMKIWSPKQRRFYTNPKYEAAKKRIRELIPISVYQTCETTTVWLSIVFHLRNVSKTWDIDNHLKAIKDALTGIAYEDDSLVRRLDCRVDKIPKGAVEGFLFTIEPYGVQDADMPRFEQYVPPLPAEKRFKRVTMTPEEFNRRYGIHPPKKFY